MELKKAIQIFEDFQAWRLGDEKYFKHSPNQMTMAIDVMLKAAKSVVGN